MSATRLWRLWGRDADYVLADADERLGDAMEVVLTRDATALRHLLRELIQAFPGNLDILREAVQRTATADDRDPVDVTASRVAAGLSQLRRCPHPPLKVARYQPEIPWLADLAERESAVRTTTWIGVRVVDQYGRPLPWMRPRLGLPNGRISEKQLDADAHTGADRLPQAGVCWLELQAGRPVSGAEPFVDVVEPPRPGPAKAATWFGIRVVDQYGRALPWMQAEVMLPDGAVAAPLLGKDATARVDSRVGGSCSVEVRARAPQVSS